MPSKYSPEIFIYKIIEEYVTNVTKHAKFWNTATVSRRTLYTSQRVEEDLKINEDTKYSEIHENNKWLNYAIAFINQTNLIDDYLNNGEYKFYLEKFYNNLTTGIKSVAKANKASVFEL